MSMQKCENCEKLEQQAAHLLKCVRHFKAELARLRQMELLVKANITTEELAMLLLGEGDNESSQG